MHWYFRDSKGIQGPLTEVMLRNILATELEPTATVRLDESSWIAAETVRAKFAKLESEGVYLRSDDKIYGPFTARRAEELEAQTPEKFDSYKIGKSGKWKPIEQSLDRCTPPPFPIESSEKEAPSPISMKQAITPLASLAAQTAKNIANDARVQGALMKSKELAKSNVEDFQSGRMSPQKKWIFAIGGCFASLLVFLFLSNVFALLFQTHNRMEEQVTDGGSTMQMFKSEFRKKFRKLDEEDLNGLDLISDKLLFNTFGKPFKTQSVGGRSYWYWRCRDGAMQLVVLGSHTFDEDAEGLNTILDLNDY